MTWKKSPPTSRAGWYSLSNEKAGSLRALGGEENLLHVARGVELDGVLLLVAARAGEAKDEDGEDGQEEESVDGLQKLDGKRMVKYGDIVAKPLLPAKIEGHDGAALEDLRQRLQQDGCEQQARIEPVLTGARKQQPKNPDIERELQQGFEQVNGGGAQTGLKRRIKERIRLNDEKQESEENAAHGHLENQSRTAFEQMAVKGGFSQADADQRECVRQRPREQLIPDTKNEGQRQPPRCGADEHQNAEPEIFTLGWPQEKQHERADARKCLQQCEDHGGGQLPMVRAARKGIAAGDPIRIADQGPARARPSTEVGSPAGPVPDANSNLDIAGGAD